MPRATPLPCLVLALLIGAPKSPGQNAPRVYRDRVEPHWMDQEHTRFWYRNDLAGGKREWVVVDATAGSRMVVDDPSKLPGTNGGEAAVVLDRERPSRQTGEATTLRFVNHHGGAVMVYWVDAQGQRREYATIEAGGQWEAQTFDGHVWVVTDEAGKAIGTYRATREAATATIGERAATVPARSRERSRNRASPDGNWVAVVRDYNLYVRPKSGGEEIRLSDDGKPGDAYDAGAVWWSPDSAKLVAMRTEPAQEHPVFTVESSPKDQLQPKLRTINYLKPGDKVAHPRPQLFDVAARKHVAIKEELFANPWSIDQVRWAADSSRFTFVYNQRGHQALRVITVSATDGSARAIVDEHSDTFIDYSGKFFCQWIGENELLWASERDGRNHLWLYDARAGQVKTCVTPGDYVVQRVDYVDEAKRQVWFEAGGVRADQDPYYVQFCRVNLDGTHFAALTEGDGSHKVKWEPSWPYFIDSYSRVDLPPVTELRRSQDGKLVCKLEEANATEALAARRHWPERFVAKGRDGKTEIYGIILRPRDFDPKKRYPVLEKIYAGPQSFFTPKEFRSTYGEAQKLADLGMIIVQCDGMGTSGRTKAFHDVCFKNLRDAGFPDRIAWITAAGKAHPEMDLSRVGVYGGSAGGQNAMAALLWHNDFYKVAVADCGCHDNRMDKIWWNEQWMGWPVDDSYAANSNVQNAKLLQGKLMLIVGEMDDNVDPASTMQVVNALEKADKDFELVVVTGAKHGAGETAYGSKRRAEFLVSNLMKTGE